jgi:hypothetical protein
MKTRFLLITLSVISLSIGCVEEEEEDSECYTQTMLVLETGEQSYKDQIARIRDPDGTWSTLEQCLKQKNLAQGFLDEYKEAENEFNTDPYYSECSAEELRNIRNVLERLIIEMESDVNMNYSCDS